MTEELTSNKTGKIIQRYFTAFISVFFFFTNSHLQAKDKIIDGFERIAIHDYFRARENFFSSIAKHPVPAYYGLSIVSARPNNPFYNLDSARVYILKADTSFRHLTAEEETRLNNKYHITAAHINSCKDSIAQLAYNETAGKKNLDAWNSYISNYSWSGFSDSATIVRNRLAFANAKAENSSRSYKDFFTLYPYSIQSAEARKRFENALFLEEVTPGTEKAFASFIVNYPESPYRIQAEDSLYAIATKQKSPESYYAFAKKYPANKNAPAAWMKLYNRYLELYSVETLNDFFNRYPDFKYRKQVEEDFHLASVVLLPVRRNEHFTFISEEGKQMIPNLYDDVDEFSEGLCAVSKKGKYGYISKSGKLEIDFKFDEADAFENGYALVKVNGKESVINRDGEMLVPAKYEEVSAPHDGRILVLDSGKYGYIDLHQKMIITPRFESATDFSGGLAVAGKEDALGVIDRNGHWVVAAKYSSISLLENGLIRVETDEQFGLLNRIGDEVLPVIYDAIGKFSSGLALVAIDEKCGYADVNGRVVIPVQYDFDSQTMDRSEFVKGFAEVKERGKSALIDSTGNKVIPSLYDDINYYGNGLPIAARKKNKWGFINLENKTLIPFRYDMVNSFSEEIAVVKTGKFFGAIGRSGETIVPSIWNLISSFKNSVAVARKEPGFGLLSKGGMVLVECGYEKYKWVTDTVIRFDRSGRYGYYNTTKKEWIWKEDGL